MVLTTEELLNKLSDYEKTILDLVEEKKILRAELERFQSAFNDASYANLKSDEVWSTVGSHVENYQNPDRKSFEYRNITAISDLLGFLPGLTFIADQNHHLIRIENQKYNPIHQIGEAIGCVNFLASDGTCGSMPICNKCQLREAIQQTQKTKTRILQKQIKLPLNINGKRKYRNFILTTSCVYLDQKELYMIYLEDSVDTKISIKELKESNSLLRNVLDSLPFSMYWKNLNSTYLGCNRMFAEQFRLKDHDAIFGLKDNDLFEYNIARENQRNDEIVHKIDTPVLQIGYSDEMLEHKRTRNSIKASLYDDSGKKIGIVGTTIDFSSKHWYELNGGEKYDRYLESVSDQMGFAIWEWHLNTDRLTGNKKWKSMMGVGNRTATVQQYLQNIDIHDQGVIISAKEEIRNSGNYKFDHQFRYLHPREKKTKWIQISGKILQVDIHGNPLKLAGNANDITIQKEREIVCQLNNQFNRALLNSPKESIWSIDHNFYITSINQTFKANFFLFFGVELEVGNHGFDALDKPLQVKWKNRFRKALKGSSFQATDEFFNEGLYIKTETLFNPIVINEEIVGVSCFSRDITKTNR